MKVLFFYIDTQTSSGYSTGLGIASISGYLKKRGIHTDLIYYKSVGDLGYALDKIVRLQPDVLGFYSTSINWRTVKILSSKIRESFPGIFQIYGGIHATLDPDTLRAIPTMDAICVGYGEVPMLKLVDQFENKKTISDITGLWVRTHRDGTDQIIRTAASLPPDGDSELLNFDHTLFLDELKRFSDYDRNEFKLDMIFVRSCPYQCSFCCNAAIKKVYAYHKFVPSPEASIDAIKRSVGETGLGHLRIHDDTFTLYKPWFRKFISLYAKEIGLPFDCNLRADSFEEEDVKLLKEANIYWAWIGIESGNDYIRNRVMKKGVSRTQIVDSIKLLHKYNISVITQNIIGVPYETPARFIDTIKINADCQPLEVANLSVFYPYPKTHLYNICIRKKVISKNYETAVEREQPVLDLPYFSKSKVLFYFKNFNLLIRYLTLRAKNRYIFFLPLSDRTSHIITTAMRLLLLFRHIAGRIIP